MTDRLVISTEDIRTKESVTKTRVPIVTKEHGAGTEIKDEEGSCRTGHQRLRSRIGI
jgi:hypothetical protein